MQVPPEHAANAYEYELGFETARANRQRINPCVGTRARAAFDDGYRAGARFVP